MRLSYEQQTTESPGSLFTAALNNRDNGIRFYNNNLKDSEYVSYFNLARIAREYAAELSQQGVGFQARVLLCAENSPEFVIAWLALLQLGAVPVPIPPSATLAGDNSFLQRLSPILSCHEHFICRVGDYEKWRGCPEAREVQFIDISGFTPARRDFSRSGSITFPQVADHSEAFIQYTSGSTSAPKGIVITYRNIVENTAALADAIGVDDDSCFLSWLPLYHDYGLVCNFMLCLLQHCNYVLTSPMAFIRRPVRFLQLVGRHNASAMCMPDFALEQILDASERSQNEMKTLDFRSLRWWSVGAEPVALANLELIERTFASHGLNRGVIAPSYGLAEATVGVSIVRPGQRYNCARVGQCDVVLNGAVIKGFTLRIENPDDNGFGHLLMGGNSVAQYAYINGEKIRISDDRGFVNTKDMGKIDNGELAVIGRSDEMLCLRGENIFPYDIEAITRKIPELDIRRVACFFQCMSQDHKIVLVYESKNSNVESHQGWHQQIREQVASRSALSVDEIYAVPTRTIPVTTSGKIQRVKAAQLYQESIFQNVSVYSSQGVR